MKVILVDDDPLVTAGLKTILEKSSKNTPDPIQVLAVCHDGASGVEAYFKYLPDIVLMDIRMPGVDGVQASQIILDKDPSAKIIFLTTFNEDDYISSALSLGVSGYILKSDYESLVPALQAAKEGHKIYGSQIIERLPKTSQTKPKDKLIIDGLSEIENEITHLVSQGLNNKEIAQETNFSEGTIRNYLSNILHKLDLRDRTQLAIYYYKNL